MKEGEKSLSRIDKAMRIFHTVRYLKSIQIRHRIFYTLRRKFRSMTGFRYPSSIDMKSSALNFAPSIPSPVSYLGVRKFEFLNLSQEFENSIDWNFSEYGKLWTYNLTYFDYLQQPDMTKDRGLHLINDFIDQWETLKDALEPFPISLRGVNWIKFLSRHNIRDQRIDDSLYAQYYILMDNLEYHLMGNHLLENGFSLLFGAYYFQDEALYAKAAEILTAELEEQILDDGAHFELSPMYHQIMLFRVLDCLNLVIGNSSSVIGRSSMDRLKPLLMEKAEKMLAWLNTISYENGDIPLLNDSANGIAPTTKQLNEYANNLNSKFKIQNSKLKNSGYRKVAQSRYECILDIGPIGPDYIPGHAHADTFNFELRTTQHSTLNTQRSMKVPFIVDTGLSTYETNPRRTEERSTRAHNTVEINGVSSSEVWGGFRVADRAYVTVEKESDREIVASHDGYLKKFGIIHTRQWIFEEDRIVIKDRLNKKANAVARLHFHPDVTREQIMKHITIHQSRLTPHASHLTSYEYAPEFNKTVEALVLEIPFEQELHMEINL